VIGFGFLLWKCWRDDYCLPLLDALYGVRGRAGGAYRWVLRREGEQVTVSDPRCAFCRTPIVLPNGIIGPLGVVICWPCNEALIGDALLLMHLAREDREATGDYLADKGAGFLGALLLPLPFEPAKPDFTEPT
jgi:hypothetical protein